MDWKVPARASAVGRHDLSGLAAVRPDVDAAGLDRRRGSSPLRWAPSSACFAPPRSKIPRAHRHRPTSRCSATSRCWCRCSSGISSCRKSCRRRLGDWLKGDLPEPDHAALRTVQPVGVHRRRALPGALHGVARRRAGARRHRVAAERPDERRPRDGLHAAAGLQIRAAADGLPADHPADDVGVPDHFQELLDRAHHRRARTDRAKPADFRIHVSRPSRRFRSPRSSTSSSR